MLIAVFVLFIIAFACRILKLKLLLRIRYDSDEVSLQLIVLLGGIRVLNYKFTAEADEKEFLIIKQYKKGKLKEEYTLKTLSGKIKRLINEYKSSFDLVEQKLFDTLKVFLSKRVKIEELSLRAILGLSDAFFTAMHLGVLYASINALLGKLYAINGMPKKTEVDIKPHFQKAVIEVHFAVMTSVRVSSLSIIGAAVVFLFLKNKERKEDVEKNNPA